LRRACLDTTAPPRLEAEAKRTIQSFSLRQILFISS
jgi:hypothetical protein